MRRILVLISFLCTVGLSAAGVINVSPAFPRAGQPVTFTLAGVTPAGGRVTWFFGNDTVLEDGGLAASCTYASPGRYRVRARYLLSLAANSNQENSTWVTVGAPFSSGPNAPFNLASVVLRWQGGQSTVSVPRDSSSLVAYADIKFEGTGQLQAQWLVDGQVMKTVTQAMSFAGKMTLDSGPTPAFPTNIPGPHDVTLRILNPAVNFRLPVLRYVVNPLLSSANQPLLEQVSPERVFAGQEVELQLTGSNFTPEMKLDLGAGITAVGPMNLLSAKSANVKVFVPPTAKVGFRPLAMIQGKDRLPSKARLEVKPPPGPSKVMSGTMPCPDQQTFEKGALVQLAPGWQVRIDNTVVNETVPVITDFTLFSWSEPVNGAAEYFELRFYDKTGQNLILTQRLPGNSGEWNTPAGFVPKLVELVKNPKGNPTGASQTTTFSMQATAKVASSGQSAPKLTKGKGLSATAATAAGLQSGPTLTGAAAQAAAQKAAQDAADKAKAAAHLAQISDVLWQIVGLRDYTCMPKATPPADPSAPLPSRPVALTPGGTLGQTRSSSLTLPAQVEEPKPVKMTLEVEASEFWPLKLPDRATGITYGTCGAVSSGTTLQAVSLAGNKDGNNYPGDWFQLAGDFTLKNSPYGFIPAQTHQVPAKPAAQPGSFNPPTVDGCTFDNVFLDWGDGTPLIPVSPAINNGTTSPGVNTTFTLPANQVKHAYARPGQYNVRVFMLSEDDVQSMGFRQDASKALASKGSEDTSFAKLLKVAAGQALLSSPGTSAGGKVATGNASGLMTLGGMQVAAGSVAQAATPIPPLPSTQQALARAYMIFCATKNIREFADPCATKPLELVALDLSFDASTGTRGALPRLTKQPAAATRATALAGAKGLPVVQQQPGPGKLMTTGPKGIEVKADAVTTTCNEAFGAHTRVRFFGHGTVRITWKVDGQVVSVSKPVSLSMKARTGLTKEQAKAKDCSQVQPAEQEINLPDFLPVKTPGLHTLTAEADVVPDPKETDLDQFAEELATVHLAGTSRPLSPATVALLGVASSHHGRSKAGTPKVGVLNPNPAPGMPQSISAVDMASIATASYVGGLTSTVGKLTWTKPPYHVDANPKTYRVETLDPKEACSIDFPTKGGSFRVTDLAGHTKTEVVGGITRMSGQGKLKVAIRAGDDATDERTALPITLSQWETDGSVVSKGEVNLANLAQPILLPGTKGTLDSLKGKVQGKGKTEDMMAHLTLSPSDASLTLTSDEKNTPVWKIEKPLSSEGDFYAEGLELPETYLGRTPWTMKSAGGVVLDYSHTQGQGPAGQGNEWVGVRLKALALRPFTFDMVGPSLTLPPVDTWYLGGADSGLHGSVTANNWATNYQEGSIKIGTLGFKALGGQNYSATYANVEVKVPWFASPIKGDVTMSKTSEGFLWSYEKVKAASMPTAVTGGFTLKPANICFTNAKNVGWTVMGDAILDFKADGRPLAAFTLDRFCYRFDGRASFEQNATTKTIALNKKSSLGNTPAELRDVVITMPTAGPAVVDFAFHSTLRLSDSPLLPAADVTIGYQAKRSGQPAAYIGTEAATSPFELKLAFPMGSPTVQGTIRPVYAPGQGSGSSARYTGEVDLGLFGGPPVKAQFVLGYQGGKDYFLCRADVPVGPSGVVLVPELLSLYKIHGGLGYNFGVDAFKDNVSILNAKPDMKGNALFSAGMRVGSSDSFTYMMDGTLTISTAAAARMDYDAWLLTANHSGQGQVKGFFQYGNGSFDGRMWGGFEFIGGLVKFTLGDSESNAAIDLHMGSDSWHVYAGQRNGARLKAKVITDGADAYIMLGSKEGLAIGGSQSYYLGVGESSVASAYAKSYLDIGVQVTPQPKIIGDFAAGMSAGVCVFGVCVDGGVDATVHAEALPLELRASCNLDLPWPLSDVSFTVHM